MWSSRNSRVVASLGWTRWLPWMAIVALAGCCATKAQIGVAIGEPIPEILKEPGHLVVVCPQETVSIGWVVSQDVTSASVTDLGSVPLPSGLRKINAGSVSKDYVLAAKGECEGTDTANVIVANAGTPFQFSASQKGSASTGTLLWEATLKTLFYSPKVRITSIKLVLPPSIGGWRVSKVDTNGAIHDFDAKNVASTPWSSALQLAGVWRLIPNDPGELDPRALPLVVELLVTLTCDEK